MKSLNTLVLAIGASLAATVSSCGGNGGMDHLELEQRLAAAESAAIRAERARAEAVEAAAQLANAAVFDEDTGGSEEPAGFADDVELLDQTESEEFDNTIASAPPAQPASVIAPGDVYAL